MYSLALAVRITVSVFRSARAPVMVASTIAVTSCVPYQTSANPVGCESVTSISLPGRGRQNPASVASGRTRLPSSSSSQLRER